MIDNILLLLVGMMLNNTQRIRIFSWKIDNNIGNTVHCIARRKKWLWFTTSKKVPQSCSEKIDFFLFLKIIILIHIVNAVSSKCSYFLDKHSTIYWKKDCSSKMFARKKNKERNNRKTNRKTKKNST